MTEENKEQEKPPQGAVPCKVCFETVDGEYARLMIKLRHEEMTKKEFFIAVINAFLEDEPNMRAFLKAYRKSKGYAQWKEEVLDREIEEGKIEMEKFGLDDSEIEDLYDIFDMQDEEGGL
jgi:hypothetical protein